MDKTFRQRVLESLPATLPELGAVLERPTRYINAVLYQLRKRGLVRKTDREGMWIGPRGPKPRLWERT